MECFSHPMETLEFVSLTILCEFENGGCGLGIMGCELWVDSVCHTQEFLCAADVGHIRGCAASKYRVVMGAFNLGVFDFAVPISTLDEANHDLSVEFGGERIKPVDNRYRALAVGLYDDTESVPAIKTLVTESLS